MTPTPTSKPHITNARLLLCLDGFGPVTIEAAILGCDAPAGRHGTVTK